MILLSNKIDIRKLYIRLNTTKDETELSFPQKRESFHFLTLNYEIPYKIFQIFTE